MYVVLKGDYLRTQFAYAPQVYMEAVQDGPTTAKMRFASSSVDTGGRGLVTEITFTNVLDFNWSDFELGLTRPNPNDSEFGLIEITNSETIQRFLREGRLRQRPLGSVKEDELHHFRLTFDDHGTFDVICTGVSSVVEE